MNTTSILFSGETVCVPGACDFEHKDDFPPSPITNLRWLNSGFWIGYASEVRKWLDEMVDFRPTEGDQVLISAHYIRTLSEQLGRLDIDRSGRIAVSVTARNDGYSSTLDMVPGLF